MISNFAVIHWIPPLIIFFYLSGSFWASISMRIPQAKVSFGYSSVLGKNNCFTFASPHWLNIIHIIQFALASQVLNLPLYCCYKARHHIFFEFFSRLVTTFVPLTLTQMFLLLEAFAPSSGLALCVRLSFKLQIMIKRHRSGTRTSRLCTICTTVPADVSVDL